MRGGDLDRSPGIRVDELLLHLRLRGGVVPHRQAESVEVPGEQRVTRALGGAPQGLEMRTAGSLPFQRAHHQLVDRRGAVRPAEVDDGQAPLQLVTD